MHFVLLGVGVVIWGVNRDAMLDKRSAPAGVKINKMENRRAQKGTKTIDEKRQAMDGKWPRE
jgi:hypothetical protein